MKLKNLQSEIAGTFTQIAIQRPQEGPFQK
jgi:hypothetical protein